MDDIEHPTAHIREHQRVMRHHVAHIMCTYWCCMFGLVALAVGVGAFFTISHAPIPTIFTIAGGLATTLFAIILFAIMSLCGSQLELWRREDAFTRLRFDLVLAIDNALRIVLGKYIPGYKGLKNELDLGEELQRETGQISERYASLQAKAALFFKEMPLLQAIDNVVRLAAAEAGLKKSNGEVIDLVERLTTPGE